MANDEFQSAAIALSHSHGHASDLAQSFMQMLPISGASVSTLGPLLGAETVSATDRRARLIDELQFDLGEGPCWDALKTRSPVLQPNLERSGSTPWPAFREAIQSENIGALFAFPLVFGPLDIGAVDLYSNEPIALTPTQKQQTIALSAIVSRVLLRSAIEQSSRVGVEAPFSRRIVHQATGMVVAQLGTTTEDAYLILQARAFADSRPMRDIATDVIERRLRFTDPPDFLREAP
ncbi:MAG TPA: GAF and ANTAR domain-containing protein [Glaciihabitans sp.]|jgi:hypothetical protein|nr:GAF and ANTAR domain-containing protein [Glaciihabitans sp.]